MNNLMLCKGKTAHLAEGLILFVLTTLLLYKIGPFNFCYLEQWDTFVYDAWDAGAVLSHPGGIVHLLSSFCVQFFIHPFTGCCLTALLLTWIALLMSAVLRRWTSNHVTFPLCLFPVASLIFLHYNVNYLYEGSVSILLMLSGLRLYQCFSKFIYRLIYSILSTLLLFMVAGPVALLYSVLLLVMEVFHFKWQSLAWIGVPLLVLAAGICSMRLGCAGDLKHLLLPDGYFTLRLQPASIIYLPWGVILSVFVLSGLFKAASLTKFWMTIGSYTAFCLGAVGFVSFGISNYIDQSNEAFKELNYYSRHNQWDKLIARCESLPMNNMLYQNCLNMALAEKGRLADELFMEPCVDIQTIYQVGSKIPYVSAILSDIYFSMGHIALSQRYAFEANEGMENHSPYMLQRLVLTNLIYGSYATAEKYIKILEHTLYYKDWATSQRRFLWNDKAVEADALLGAKRRCLFPDNRFSSMKGLDDDLKQIVLNNPSHKTTIQYLGCLYLLSKDMPRFMETLETFYGTEALPAVLPLAFQEGVAICAAGDEALLKHYRISDSVCQRFERFKQQPRSELNSLWYFLMFMN